jgi:hypothetical protein
MSAWLEGIEATLKASLGTNTKKREVYAVAKDMDELPACAMADGLRSLFLTWVSGQHYLYDAARELDPKPSTLPPLERVERESKQARDRRLDDRADAGRERVARYADARRDGWPVDEARCFVCTEEEAIAGENRYRMRAA